MLHCLFKGTVGWNHGLEILSSAGEPTVFIVDVPISLLQAGDLEEFAGLVLEDLFCEALGDRESLATSPHDCGSLSVSFDVPAECIVGLYYIEPA